MSKVGTLLLIQPAKTDTQVTQHTNDTQVLPGGTSSLKGQDAQDHLGMTSPSSY